MPTSELNFLSLYATMLIFLRAIYGSLRVFNACEHPADAFLDQCLPIASRSPAGSRARSRAVTPGRRSSVTRMAMSISLISSGIASPVVLDLARRPTRTPSRASRPRSRCRCLEPGGRPFHRVRIGEGPDDQLVLRAQQRDQQRSRLNRLAEVRRRWSARPSRRARTVSDTSPRLSTRFGCLPRFGSWCAKRFSPPSASGCTSSSRSSPEIS